MKAKSISYLAAVLAVVLVGCKYDNFEPPQSMLTGRVVHDGQPVGVRYPSVTTNGANTTGGVQLELWQPGYPVWRNQKIPVYVAQDGSFSAAVFDGDYKLTRLRGNGPWADNTDTINVSVRGNTVVEVPVSPYFVTRNETIQRSAGTVTATFNLQHVNTSRQLERVNLYIGTTMILDAVSNAGGAATAQRAASAISNLNDPITLTVNLPPNLANREYVFARIGVKTLGVGELLYSPVQRLNLR